MNGPQETAASAVGPFRLIKPELQRVREAIRQSIAAGSGAFELTPLFDHLGLRSGKMLRPGLVLLAGKCFGPTTNEHVHVGAMVEMIHHATLLHDDVIDDGRTRRGVPTVNRLWGNESAVLLGDFVLSQVFRMAADLEPPASRIVAETAGQVCHGELRQVVQKGNWQLSETQYIDIITEKTASFFSGCCRLGGMLAGADEDQIEALARFGLHAGIAFQITDDLLDIAGDESTTGKTGRSDFAKDKLTLSVIHLLRTIDVSRRAEALRMLESPEQAGAELVGLLRQQGALQYAREQADGYVASAVDALGGLPGGEIRDALVTTARIMANRMN